MKKAEIAFIVDDDNIFTGVFSKLVKLKRACDSLMIFENGAVALEHLQMSIFNSTNVPDLILLDINMPIMDGFDFLNEFIKLEKKLPKPITIYMITSSINPRDRQRAEEFSQVSQFIVKPIQLAEIESLFMLPEQH